MKQQTNIFAYLWTSGGKITGGEIEDDITGVILDVDACDSTVKTAVFIEVEEKFGTALAGVFATGVEVCVANAVERVVPEGVELKGGITVAAVVMSTVVVDVFLCTGK